MHIHLAWVLYVWMMIFLPVIVPQHWIQPESKMDVRSCFWVQWQDDTDLARGQGDHWNKAEWAKFLDRRKRSQVHAPQWWLRRIHNLSCVPHHKAIIRATWMYVMYNTRSRHVYVGQTGAMGTLKSIVTRWRLHGRAGPSFATLYGNKNCKARELF